MSQKKVSYFYDADVGAYTYGLGHPMKPQRMRMTHELVSVYGMVDKMDILRANRATGEQMTRFHTDEYVHFLQNVTPETCDKLSSHGTRFLVGDDNPAWDGLFEFCSLSAGGSIEAAQRLTSGAADIAINWAGGLHHAKKREASGFCYVNDIVLGILELLRFNPRVLYIDIDCHHGDGVEEAFYTSERVMTCSFHKFGEYFPGTGTQDDRGRGSGRGYAVNVPLKDGITDESYRSVFEPVIYKINEVFRPSAIVLQCGADSLAGDKLGCFNITMQGHANCVQFVRKLGIPFMMVGGGGYTVKNVARTWTYETACALGVEDTIDPNMPWNEYFEWFGPRYQLEVVRNNMEDLNTKDGSLDKVREIALQHISELRPAPSVGLQDVPRESIGRHLGFSSQQMAADETDEKLAQNMRLVWSLQDASTSDEEDELGTDSDDDSVSEQRSVRDAKRIRAGKARMSIMTNQLMNIPQLEDNGHGYWDYGLGHIAEPASVPLKPSRRRFFQSSAQWDDTLRRVTITNDVTPQLSIAELMANGGRGGDHDLSDPDEMDLDDEEGES